MTVINLQECSHCGQLGNNIQTMDDPYLLEVYDEHVQVALCPECAQQRADDA